MIPRELFKMEISIMQEIQRARPDHFKSPSSGYRAVDDVMYTCIGC